MMLAPTLPAPAPWTGAPTVAAFLSVVDAYLGAVNAAEALLASCGPTPQWVHTYSALGHLDACAADLEELLLRAGTDRSIEARSFALAQTKLRLFRRRAACMIEAGADLEAVHG